MPVLYGFFEAVVYFPFCFLALFAGWTLSPKPKIPYIYDKHDGDWIWTILINDYQYLIEKHPHYAEFKVDFNDDYVEKEISKLSSDDSGDDESESVDNDDRNEGI